MRIYVASSWRNTLQPAIVLALRRSGHDVYDFRHPAPGNTGFRWSDCAEPGVNWQDWTPDEYRRALEHPIAVAGHKLDLDALRACDACVLVLPSGRSASWELGYAMGQGKRAAVVQLGKVEPELMYRGAQIITSMDELYAAFGEPRGASALKIWTNDYETCIADSASDARRIAIESAGDSAEDAQLSPIDYWHEDTRDAIEVIDRTTGTATTRTAAEWIAVNGPGFLCSREF